MSDTTRHIKHVLSETDEALHFLPLCLCVPFDLRRVLERQAIFFPRFASRQRLCFQPRELLGVDLDGGVRIAHQRGGAIVSRSTMVDPRTSM